MNVDIHSITTGQVILSAPINEGAMGRFSLMKEDYILLPLSLSAPIRFKYGDYVDMEGVLGEYLGGKMAKRYEVAEDSKPVRNTENAAYDYQLRLDAYYIKWKHKIFKYTPEGHGQEASWTLTAALDVHLGIFLRNLDALGYDFKGTKFTYSIDQTVEMRAITLTYSNTNMLDALTMMAEALDCEWWVTENVINFGRCEFGNAVDIEIFVQAASMERSDSKGTYATRLYVFGGERNIPADYRTADESVVVNGVVQRRLMLPEGTPFLDAYPGMTEEEAIEAVVIIDDIYPKRVGTIADVTSYDSTVENEDGTTTTETFYRYRDEDLEFSEEYILPGQALGVQFQSGLMTGMSFEVKFNPLGDDPFQWEIVQNEDYGRPLPDELIKPQDGDTYVLYGFDTQYVSDQLLPEAELELKAAGEKYLAKTMVDDSTFTTTLYSDWVASDKINRTFGVGQRINLINPGYFENGRVSRVIGWEFKLDIPWEMPVYTIGESAQYSRIGALEDSLDAITYRGYTYAGNGGGGGYYLIRTNDTTYPSDSNVFSALRSLAMFHRKDKTDENPYLQRFLKGAEFGKFTSGLLGTGGAVNIDENGNSHAEFDYLTIRKTALFVELVVQQAQCVGGMIVVSPAGMTVSEVVETEDAYRCYFESTDGDRTLQNQFAVGDQARRQTFNLTTQAYYWRLVTAVGDDYIDLSKTDCDAGSGIPQAGDEIVSLGNRTDKTRQHAIVIAAYGDGAPYIRYYQGIDSYSLEGKEIKADYYDLATGRFKTVAYGDSYVGAKDGSTYMKFTQEKGVEIKGDFYLSTGVDILTQFSIIEGLIRSEISSVRDEINAQDNYLRNASFSDNLDYWQGVTDIDLFTVDGRLLCFNANFYGNKKSIAGIAAYAGKNVLRLKNSHILQKNDDYAMQPEFYLFDQEGQEDAQLYRPRDFYISFTYMVTKPGTLKIGFDKEEELDDFEPYEPIAYEQELQATDGFQLFEISGKWNGTGDFRLSFSGDMYLYSLAITDNKLADIETKYDAMFEMTAEKIQANLEEIHKNGEKIEAYRSEFLLTAREFELKFEEVGESISSLRQTAEMIEGRVEDAEGNISTLTQTASSLASRITNAEGDISTLEQTANSLRSRISTAEGDISTLEQTAGSLTSRISTAEGDISTLEQTAGSLTSRITNAEGDISTLEQQVGSIEARVEDAEGNYSSLKVQVNGIQAVTNKLEFDSSGNITNINTSGLVTTGSFASLFASQMNSQGVVTEATISTFIEDGIANAEITADQIRFTGYTIINGSFVVDTAGNLTLNDITLRGSISGNNATLNDITANNLTLRGSIDGNNATLNDITARNITLSGTIDGNNATLNDVTLNDITANNLTANSGTFSGDIYASGGRIGSGLYLYGSGISSSSAEFELAGDGFQLSKNYLLYVANNEMARVFPDYPSGLADAVLEVSTTRGGRRALHIANGGMEAYQSNFGLRLDTTGVYLTANKSNWYMPAVLLAIGAVNGTVATPTVTLKHQAAGIGVSVRRQSEGYYYVAVSGASGTAWHPLVVGIGSTKGNSLPQYPVKATLGSYTNSGFYVETSDDESPNDGQFLFMLVGAI